MKRYSITDADRAKANQALANAGQPDWKVNTDAEAMCVLDAIANGDDVLDHLDEHRMWRTQSGRNDMMERIGDAYDRY